MLLHISVICFFLLLGSIFVVIPVLENLNKTSVSICVADSSVNICFIDLE